MKKSEKRKRLAEISERLCAMYPAAECALDYKGDPWRLLVMGRLSAQCTDARVNEVSVRLFERFPTPEAMADGELSEIENIVKPCGVFRMKAANIKDASRQLVEEYGGILPDTMEELLTFSGVGRKIANLLLGDIFGKPAVVCDTHCIRICGRLGMYPESEKNPAKNREDTHQAVGGRRRLRLLSQNRPFRQRGLYSALAEVRRVYSFGFVRTSKKVTRGLTNA